MNLRVLLLIMNRQWERGRAAHQAYVPSLGQLVHMGPEFINSDRAWTPNKNNVRTMAV